MTAVVLLAAGRGVRMKSSRPKVLHEAAGRPLLECALETALAVAGDPANVVVVVSKKDSEGDSPKERGMVGAFLAAHHPRVRVAIQDPPRGTGDAVRAAAAAGGFGNAKTVVVLSGDVPLLSADAVKGLVDALKADKKAAVAVLTATLANPAGYGRIVRDKKKSFVRIREEKDSSNKEKGIREINTGTYAFDRAFLEKSLPVLTSKNSQNEFYLTDVLSLARKAGRRVLLLEGHPSSALGVNSREDLADVDRLLRERAVRAAMRGGATILRPETVTLDETVVLGEDTTIEPFVTLLGKTRVGGGTVIGQGCVVRDTVLGKNVVVKPYCVIESAVVGDGSIVGPFARLREGTELAPGVHVGNFVETKKAKLREGVKANHLTYLGDTEIGARTNVGAGVITCNYDGYAKHRTTIGADVFVGSDVQLVAPVTVGDGAIVGAGTTVTKDVPKDGLAVSRTPQRNLEGGGAAYRARKKKKG
ncbi:MAG TPA: bifunctional UDP-N-acetylglucosamine diphosphorylase/glucosamine-1-phosphate N-acetyltransferase GlmU [Thermoanaerobaculia bacterium]|nr:bifunctional UDP-N-acetylglucosamine diphosphorylase/glucosamine-1-phosphate N-acetyltransferase GlmU [Thermoanaerobaculia bacterium]